MYGIEIQLGEICTEWEEGRLEEIVKHTSPVETFINTVGDDFFDDLRALGLDYISEIFPRCRYEVGKLQKQHLEDVDSVLEGIDDKSKQMPSNMSDFLRWFKTAIEQALTVYKNPGIRWY